MKLYEIPILYRDVMAKIAEKDGECSDEDLAALDAIEGTLSEKVDNICALEAELRAEAAMFKGLRATYDPEIKRLKGQEDSANAHADRLKAYLMRTLKQMELTKAEGMRFKVRIQKNGTSSIKWNGLPESIPEPFKRVTIELDGKAAQQAYTQGCLPTEGFTIETGSHLRIQ